MASSAAQQMFGGLSPEEQARVQASLAGNPNGLEDWYQAAARAGDPRAIRAGGQGQSEDFARFNEGTVTGWAKGFYDEAASRAAGRPQFRSMRGAEGYFDKPTECPPGMGPSGPNESDPCTTKGYSEPAGGSVGSPGASDVSGGGSNVYSPLSDLLANQGSFLGGQGAKGGTVGGGGIWWQPGAQQTAPAPTSALDGLMGGLTAPATASNPLVNTLTPLQGGFKPGGLTNMLGQQQRKMGRVQRSPTNTGSWF